MLDNLQKYNIILASNSPRRRELLVRMGLDFKVRPLVGIDETFPKTLKGEEIVKHIATEKAEAYLSVMESPNELIIAADTLVFLEDEILGKPRDYQEAKAMLEKLSGRTHQVMTGVCVITKEKKEVFAETTHVRFSLLDETEIDYYIKQYLPFDKAGGYGIQEWIGYVGVEQFNGSYFNVMGLPTQSLYKVLKKF